MQIMPETWSHLRVRYGLGADPYDPRDNILAVAAYLRELYDRYGSPGFLAAYNAGPTRYEDHLTTSRSLPADTLAYIADVVPLIGVGTLEDTMLVAAVVCAWTEGPLLRPERSAQPSQPSSNRRVGQPSPVTANCALDASFTTFEWNIRAHIGADIGAMTSLARHHAVEGFGEGWRVARRQPRDQTNGRQGKRPAVGAAHVVGKIEEFTNVTNIHCRRFLQIAERFQSSERRRSGFAQSAPS
jgi:Transglycosylase SLT domain